METDDVGVGEDFRRCINEISCETMYITYIEDMSIDILRITLIYISMNIT